MRNSKHIKKFYVKITFIYVYVLVITLLSVLIKTKKKLNFQERNYLSFLLYEDYKARYRLLCLKILILSLLWHVYGNTCNVFVMP